jgi:hypothetical protein
MPRLFSYVVEHDYCLSPNPSGGFCTLAFCKFSMSARRNIVELAEPGDWIVGTGGAGPDSAGHGRLIYAMRVTEKLTLRDYFRDPRFCQRAGNLVELAGQTDMFALVSDHFYYFGATAPKLAKRHVDFPIEKRGPGFRSRFPESFIADFVLWLEDRYDIGIHGSPCVNCSEGDEEPLGTGEPSRKCPPRRPRPRC